MSYQSRLCQVFNPPNKGSKCQSSKRYAIYSAQQCYTNFPPRKLFNYTFASYYKVFKIPRSTAILKRKIIYIFFGKFFRRKNKICNKTGQANF